jgi:hypothetical protein
MLIEHHASHINKSVVLSFHNSILLRNTQGRKLLINTVLKTKLIERGIPELSPIVTLNGFQAVGMFTVQPQCQAPKVLKHLILAFQKGKLRVMRIVINDDKDVPLASHEANPRGTDSVHTSPNLTIVWPSSTRPVLDHPRFFAPDLLLLPRSLSLSAMSHLLPTDHEISKCDSPHETRIKVKLSKYLGFKFKHQHVNDTSQSKQGTGHLVSHGKQEKSVKSKELEAWIHSKAGGR